VALMPGAIVKLIPKHNTRRRAAFNRLNLHIAVSEADSLYGFFSGADVCANLYVRRSGVIEQYIDTDFCSAADLEGNDGSVSVETQGGVTNADGEPWTPEQVAALARIYAWVRAQHGVANKLATTSRIGDESKGLSWHRLGIDPWRVSGGMRYSSSRGKRCPGDARIAQVPAIFAASQDGTAPVAIPASTPAPIPAVTSERWLQRGNVGAAVGELQGLLTAAGFPCARDNSFGPDTEAQVRAYQGSRGLVIDGLAGEATMSALRSGRPAAHAAAAPGVLRRGSSGADVKRLQERLRTGYPAYAKKLVADGSYGPATEAVVREFQRRSGLAVDGICGPKTRAALGI